MDQQVEFFLYMHEDLCFSHFHSFTSSNLKAVETWILGSHWPANLAEIMNSGSGERICVKTKRKWKVSAEDTQS